MTRLTEDVSTAPPEGDATPRRILASLQGKYVCPFCGAVKDAADKPCPRCTMEDTPQTRQATRNRIGPWYVLQTRNPSAPGMKFETLLILVRRGQVTPRAIVRGPTTHQLWRFAAKVKGLSREFGLCYACGGDIETNARVCVHCQKLQEPPPNPDVLLESQSGFGPVQPIHRELPQPHPRPEQADPAVREGDDSTESHAPAGPADQGTPSSDDELAATIRSGQSDERAYAALAAPSPAPSPAAGPRPREKAAEGILSAKELAAAFRLDFQPGAGVEELTAPRRSRWFLKTLAALLFVAIATVAIMMALLPEFRHELKRRGQSLLSAAPAGPAAPAASSSPTAAPSQPRPRPRPAIAPPPAPAEPKRVEPQPAIAATTRPADPPKPDAALAPAPSPSESQKRVESIEPVEPAERRPAPPVVAAPATQPTTTRSLLSRIPLRLPSVATAPASPAPPAERIDPAVRARQLRRDAIDAESKLDFSQAIRLYEQIKTLPRAAWPADLDLRLDYVKRQSQDQKR